jgi:hypothetical protein
MAISQNTPTQIVAGDSANWQISTPTHPSTDGWVVGYEFVNAASRQTATSTPDGCGGHLVSISVAQTTTWPAGAYQWRARALRAAEAVTILSGSLQVLPAFGAAIDARSSAQKALDAVIETLSGRASSATAEYEIEGRKLKYIPIGELLRLKSHLTQEVAKERAAAGAAPIGRIYVRWGSS